MNYRRLLSALSPLLFLPNVAHAATSGQNLPWERGLTLLVNSITGPVAYAVSVIAVVTSGSLIIWGGEMSDFAKTTIRIVLALGLILGATQIITAFFGISASI